MKQQLLSELTDSIQFNGWEIFAYKSVVPGSLILEITLDGTSLGKLYLNARGTDVITEAYSSLAKIGLAATSNSRYKLDKWLSEQIVRC